MIHVMFGQKCIIKLRNLNFIVLFGNKYCLLAEVGRMISRGVKNRVLIEMLFHKRMKYMSMNLHLLMAVTQQARLPFVLDDKNNVGLLILTTNLYMWSVWLGEHFSLHGCRKI